MKTERLTRDVFCYDTCLTFTVDYLQYPPEPDSGYPNGYTEVLHYSLVCDAKADTFVEELLIEDLRYD